MKTKYPILIFLLLAMASCNDYLEVDNQRQLSNSSFWQTEKDVQQGLTAAYAALSSWDGSKWTFFEEVFLGMVIRSDETANNQSSGYVAKLASFTNVPDESTANNLWLTRYAGIARANQVIQHTPDLQSTELSDDGKRSYVAEAKFLRALNYFYLVCSFENIPKVTEYTDDFSKLTPEQVPASEIWSLIEADLTEAEQYLPDTQDEEWSGRATKWSAKALLGKVYLFQEKWSQAASKFAEVVNDGPYSLLTNYSDNFNGAGENGVESVFEIQFSGNRSNGVDKRQPINWEITPAAIDGWELFYASDWILTEMKKDVTPGGDYSDRVYASLFFDDPASFMRKPTETEEISYESVKDNLTFSQYFKKYNAWTDLQGDYVGTNVSLIRYSDVLLMYAEALNETGMTSDAVEQINVVRARSHAVLLDAPDFDQNSLRIQIRHHERPTELSMEYGIRWLDLYRWNRGKVATESVKETLTAHGKAFSENFVEGKHEINPVPAQERAVNPSLKQNNGF